MHLRVCACVCVCVCVCACPCILYVSGTRRADKTVKQLLPSFFFSFFKGEHFLQEDTDTVHFTAG